MDKTEYKNPIKDKPVRQAGQSAREKRQSLLDDEVMPYLMVTLMVFVFALFEWVRVFWKLPPQHIPLTIIFAFMLIKSIRKFYKLRSEARNLFLGEEGEQAVGQLLEEKLRPKGCNVFHDILADDFNVDHFVVGPTGLFCIETKTHRKPERGGVRVVFDGETIRVNGFKPDRDPVIQVKAEAKWMSDLIEKSTGKRFHVQPVLVYPGWYVEMPSPAPQVWALNEQVAPTFISNARTSLSPEEIALITFNLKRYVVNKDKELVK
jgi:hypothetical protein